MYVRSTLMTVCLLLSLSYATVASAAPTSSVRVLSGNSMAMQARIDLIQRAEHTIDLAYYGVNTDEVPIAILELLRQASGRGVKVRLVVDCFRSKLPKGLNAYLKRSGIQIYSYHSGARLNPQWLNQRIHSKLIVADSSIAIVGSRNLEDEHFGLGEKTNFIDCEALVSGEIAYRVQSYFNWLWRLPDTEPIAEESPLRLGVVRLHPKGRSDWNKAWRAADDTQDYRALLNHALQRVTCRLNVELNSGQDLLSDSIYNSNICLLRDCCVDKSERKLQRDIIRIMDSACHCLLIETPYPAFHANIRKAISRARRRGVSVLILTNSLESTNRMGVYAAYQNQKRGLLREGVQLRELCGRDTLHSKTMIVDHKTWMLGSYNFDCRSDLSNLEIAIVSDCPEGAAMLAADMEPRLRNSTLIESGKIIMPVGANPTWCKRPELIMRRCVVEAYRGLL